MVLTEFQKDALSELINIGYARAAGALSQLTGHRILLEVPSVAVHRLEDVADILKQVVKGEVTSVNQVFSGAVAGNALLLLDSETALLLTRLLTDGKGDFDVLDQNAREVITEVGNIVLNACLGVFGNLLQVNVTFSVPRLHIETVEAVLHSTIIGHEPLSHALIVRTRFHLRSTNLTGYLAIILGVTSLDRLLLELARWEERQMKG
jgi:chemotaxis protein CheC